MRTFCFNHTILISPTLTQSLTPSRNNGFINMLAVMKAKASKYASGGLGGSASAESEENVSSDASASQSDEVSPFITSFEEIAGKPMYNEMMASLLKLRPLTLELEDGSDQHAGHAGSKGWAESGESHFDLTIVADAFSGMSLVKRHKLVYMLLGDTMQKIHALQISAKAPDEVEDQ